MEFLKFFVFNLKFKIFNLLVKFILIIITNYIIIIILTIIIMNFKYFVIFLKKFIIFFKFHFQIIKLFFMIIHLIFLIFKNQHYYLIKIILCFIKKFINNHQHNLKFIFKSFKNRFFINYFQFNIYLKILVFFILIILDLKKINNFNLFFFDLFIKIIYQF